MKSKWLGVFIWMVAFGCGDDEALTPSDAFIKYFGGAGSHTLADMEPIVDGAGAVTGFVLFGTQRLNEGEANDDWFVVVTDQNGNLTDSAVMHYEPADGFESASAISVTENRGFLLTGTYSPDAAQTSTQTIYARLNSSLEGDIEMFTTVENRVASDIIETSDGGLVVVGAKEVGSPAEWNWTLTKILDGIVVFDRQEEDAFGIPSLNNSDDFGVKVRELTDGRLVMLCQTEVQGLNGEGGLNVMNAIFTSNGIGSNGLIYGITDESEGSEGANLDDIPTDIIIKPGGFAITGVSRLGDRSSAFYMDVNEAGSVNEQRILTTPEQVGSGAAIAQLPNLDYVVVGSLRNTPDKQEQAFFTRLDQGGNSRGIEQNYGLSSGNDRLVAVSALPSGKIVMAGTWDFGSNLTLFALMKVNELGELKR